MTHLTMSIFKIQHLAFNIINMESFLEILKYTIPALIVFLTSYFLIKMHLEEQQQTRLMAFQNEQIRLTIPVKMQAYERLAIMIDRIGIPGMIARLRTPEMSVGELQLTLMMCVQQEFDYNAGQQIYVSETAWKIIQAAKEGTLAILDRAGEPFTQSEPGEKLVGILLANHGQQEFLTAKTLQAIRTEAASIF